MEAFLREVLPKVIGQQSSFEVYPSQGKSDLMGSLEGRLRAYASWLPPSWRVIVVVDRDSQDCAALKAEILKIMDAAGLVSREVAPNWRVADCIAIEELEAWYFGEWTGVAAAYPRVSLNVPARAAYRHSDRIAGGAWEAFERELQRAGYFQGGLRKIEAARTIGASFQPDACTSPSFQRLIRIVTE